MMRFFVAVLPFVVALSTAAAVAAVVAMMAWRSPPPPPFVYVVPPHAIGSTALCPGDLLVYQTVTATEGSPSIPAIVERKRTLWDAEAGMTIREVTQDVDTPATSIWFESTLVTNTITYPIPFGLDPGLYELRTVAFGPATTPRGGPVAFEVRDDCADRGD